MCLFWIYKRQWDNKILENIIHFDFQNHPNKQICLEIFYLENNFCFVDIFILPIIQYSRAQIYSSGFIYPNFAAALAYPVTSMFLLLYFFVVNS